MTVSKPKNNYVSKLKWQLHATEAKNIELTVLLEEANQKVTCLAKESAVTCSEVLVLRERNKNLQHRLHKKGVYFDVLFVIAVIMLVTLIFML